MKLIIGIAQERDKRRLFDRFTVEDIKFTVLNSTGGFLRQGNFTVLIGIDDNDVESVMSVFRECCRTVEEVVSVPAEVAAILSRSFTGQAVKAKVGGAVAFVIDVERLESF
jgi:uncharacterized protein YaaQ